MIDNSIFTYTGVRTLYITMHYNCNLNCEYCFQKKDKEFYNKILNIDHNIFLIGLENFLKKYEPILDAYLHIQLSGGECFYNLELLQNTFNICEKYLSEKHDILYDFMTNGYLLEDQNIKKFLSNIKKYKISISFDSNQKSPDKLPNNIWNTLLELHKQNRLFVTYVIKDKNDIDCLSNKLKYLNNKNIAPKLNYNTNKLYELTKDTCDKLYNILKNYNLELGNPSFKRSIQTCRTLLISPDVQIFPCFEQPKRLDFSTLDWDFIKNECEKCEYNLKCPSCTISRMRSHGRMCEWNKMLIRLYENKEKQ